ncbi:MAG: DUF4190 domain-containing protein [Micrococcales bacterium]|nr:DUF4190 domain-containing protein [Micrococcales bacterium]
MSEVPVNPYAPPGQPAGDESAGSFGAPSAMTPYSPGSYGLAPGAPLDAPGSAPSGLTPPAPPYGPTSVVPAAPPSYGTAPPEPSGYYAGYGYPGQYGYAPPATTNGLAVAGMITGIVSCIVCPIAAVVGLVLSIIALGQVRRDGTAGRGFAITGVATSSVGLLLVVVSLLVVLTSG